MDHIQEVNDSDQQRVDLETQDHSDHDENQHAMKEVQSGTGSVQADQSPFMWDSPVMAKNTNGSSPHLNTPYGQEHSNEQSLDFSPGELSLSADSYALEESTVETMDQSIRSAIAGLDNRPSDAGTSFQGVEEHQVQSLSTQEITFEEDSISLENKNEAAKQSAGNNLNESFSSEVTEPEPQVETEPPMALLMYSQPKVWTDDSGEPTNLMEEDEEEQESGSHEEQAEGTLVAENEGRTPSAAGLWMQDDMLQTIVPYRQTQMNPESLEQVGSDSEPIMSISPSSPEIERDCVSRSSPVDQTNVSKSSVRSISSTDSQSKIKNTSSSQSSSLNQSKKEQKDSTNSLPNLPQRESAKKSQSKIPKSQKNTSSESLRNTSTSSLNSSHSKAGSETQLRGSINKQQQQPKLDRKSSLQIQKSKSVSDHAPKPAETVQSQKSLSKKSGSKEKVITTGQSQHVSHQSNSSLISLGETQNTGRGSNRSQETNLRGETISGSHRSLVGQEKQVSAPPDEVTPQETILQQLQQSRIALQEQSQRFQGHLQANLQGQQAQGHAGQHIQGQRPQGHYIEPVYDHLQVNSQGQQAQGHAGQLVQSQRPQGHYTEPMYDHLQVNSQGQQAQGHVGQHVQGQRSQGHYIEPAYDQSQGYHRNMKASAHGGHVKSATETLDEVLGDAGTDVFSMEQVRGHLQAMLKQTTHALPEKSYDSGQMTSLILDEEDESFLSNSGFPNTVSKSLADLTAQMETLGGFGAVAGSGLGAISSKAGGAPVTLPRGDATLVMENQLIRETLEKEMFRRKHCEKQIHLLQSKNLEVQQQLAVAVNTDRKKDTMIEQLDKALAKVVDGWRKREGEKVEIIQRLQVENQQLSSRSEAQQQLLYKFEAETAVVVDQLTSAQQSVQQSQRDRDHKVAVADRERLETLEMLEETQDKLNAVTTDSEQHRQQAEKLDRQLRDLRCMLDAEREAWEEKEREFLQKIDEITDNHMRVIEQGKLKSDQQTELLKETHELLTASQNEVHELRLKLDSSIREKDSLHVQMGILESKMENSLRKQEADLRSEAERQMSERLAGVHRRQTAQEEDRSERHRHQVADLSQRHSAELKELTRQHQDALRRKDETLTEKALEFEEKLCECREEVETLQNYVKKLEGQRMEVTTRLHAKMQAHFTEALGILMNGETANRASDLTPAVKKQLDGMYTMVLNDPDTDPAHATAKPAYATVEPAYAASNPAYAASNPAYAASNPAYAAADPYTMGKKDRDVDSGSSASQEHQSRGTDQQGFTTTTSSDVTSGPFSTLQPDFSSPPEIPVSMPTRLHGNSPDDFVHNVGYQDAPMSLSRDWNATDTSHHQESLPDGATTTMGLPFRGYSTHTNYNYHVSGSYQPAQTDQPSTERSQGTSVSVALPVTTSGPPTSNMASVRTNQQTSSVTWLPGFPPQVATHARQDRKQTTLTSRPEVSFLETLASEADRQARNRGSSHNSTLLSEYEGMTPMPQDTDLSTITDDGAHQDLTALSSRPLPDTSQFSELLHQSVAPARSHGNESDFSPTSERHKQPDDRQHELKRYIKMLLNQDVEDDGAATRGEQTPPAHDQSLLTPTKNQPSPIQFRGQGHPPGVAFAKTKVPVPGLPRPDFGSVGEDNRTATDSSHMLGALTPGQSGEISRLLSVYRDRASVDPDQTTFSETSAHVRGPASNKQPSTHQEQDPYQVPEMPTREQHRAAGTRVIKVPTASELTPKSSPTRNKSATRGQPKPAPAPRQAVPVSKPDRKSAAPSDRKEKPKGGPKVWK